MPPPLPPPPLVRRGPVLPRKGDGAMVAASPDKTNPSTNGGTVAQLAVTTSLPGVDARHMGRAIPRTILRPSTSSASKPAPADLNSLPPRAVSGPPAVQEVEVAPRPSKASLVTSTSTNTTESTFPQESSLFPDNTPIQTCLEYLTRPHRSWDSANKIRELQRRRVREHSLTVENCRSLCSLANCTRSCASSSSNVSISAHSAPPTVGRPRVSPSSSNTRSRGGVAIRRGRFGMLPGVQPEAEGLAVGGSRLALPGARPHSRLHPLAVQHTATKNQRQLPSYGLSVSAMSRNTSRDFAFSMQ